MENDPLDVLFEKAEELDLESRKKLAAMVLPYIAIDPDSGELFLKSQWSGLSNALKKILVIFLAKFALSVKDPDFLGSLQQKDIEEIADIPGGTVRPKVRELANMRIIKQVEDGSYIFKSSQYAINTAYKLLESESNE